MSQSNYRTETGTFKNHAIISIFEGEDKKVSFGVKKAAAILASIEEIKKFVEANEKTE